MSHPSTALAQDPGQVSPGAMQRVLREQQTLLDSAGVGIVFIRHRVVVRCNQRYAEIFGLSCTAEAVGRSSEGMHPNRDAFRELGRAAFAVLSQGQAFRTERQMRRSSRTKMFELGAWTG